MPTQIIDGFPDDAPWLYHQPRHIEVCLQRLTRSSLRDAYETYFKSRCGDRLKKAEYVSLISNEFQDLSFLLRTITREQLSLLCASSGIHAQQTRSVMQALYVQIRFGPFAFAAFTTLGPCPQSYLRLWPKPDTQNQSGLPLCPPFTQYECERFLKGTDAEMRAVRAKLSAIHPFRHLHDRSDLTRCGYSTLKRLFYDYLCLRVQESCQAGVAGCVYANSCLSPFDAFPNDVTHCELVKLVLMREFDDVDLLRLTVPLCFVDTARDSTENAENEHIVLDGEEPWPQKVTEDHTIHCMRKYWFSSNIKPAQPCSICARSRQGVKLDRVEVNADTASTFNLSLLQITDDFIQRVCIVQQLSTEFTFGNPLIDSHFIYKGGVTREGPLLFVDICVDCSNSLKKNIVPQFALANKLYRGELPKQFSDLTWSEEMVCARVRQTAHVTRLFASNDPRNPRVFYGNTCAHEMNTTSTADVLPRTPADVAGTLAVVFVGSSPFRSACLKDVFRVRKQKIWDFLLWLKDNNCLYKDITLDERVCDDYPEDGALPGINNCVVETGLDSDIIFGEETAGLDDHPILSAVQTNSNHFSNDASDDTTPAPASQSPIHTINFSNEVSVDDSDNADEAVLPTVEVLLEHTGVSDPEGANIPARTLQAAAFQRLAQAQAQAQTSGEHGQSRSTHFPQGSADLFISHSKGAVREYNNPSLFPAMYPTLYPFGIGGFDDPSRCTPLGFQQQANYYLDLDVRRFRYHHSAVFVMLNIWQRRQAHLFTHLTVARSSFAHLSSLLSDTSSTALQHLADTIRDEGKIPNLSSSDKNLFEILKLVNAVAGNLPGSHAAKLRARNDCVAYCGAFGIPLYYLTINPNPVNSPVFSLMAGDTQINLDDRYPNLLPSNERARLLAKDPVAAADFYEFSIRLIFEDLFAWDFTNQCSAGNGGILGKLRAFKGTNEFTDRGTLHGHFLLWMEGSMNPDELHAKVRDDIEYRERFFSHLDAIIKHDLPKVESPQLNDPSVDPRCQRPPLPPELGNPNMSKQQLNDEKCRWKILCDYELKFLGETCQRHVCRPVCHKYGNEGKCRFQFPHDVVLASWYDNDSDSIFLATRDANVNYYSPAILVMCRHNHDIRFILSGKSAKAAIFYITDYITKMDLKTYEILSLMSKAVIRAFPSGKPEGSEDASIDVRASSRTLLHKCLSQFNRGRQVHAQQAVRYLRGLDDTVSSHSTVPMLSSALMRIVKLLYCDSSQSEPSQSLQSHFNGGSVEDRDNLQEQHNDEGDNNVSGQDHSDRVALNLDDSGLVVTTNQIADYIYRDDRLSHICYYDFVRCFKLVKKRSSKRSNESESPVNRHNDGNNNAETAGDSGTEFKSTSQQPPTKRRTARFVLSDHYSLKAEHQLSKSHSLHQVEDVNGSVMHVPRVYGCSIPRKHHGELYYLFALAHFKPFSLDIPLLPPSSSAEMVFAEFNSYPFKKLHKKVMRNWEALHECSDARDADRLKKRQRPLAQHTAHDDVYFDAFPSELDCESEQDIHTLLDKLRSGFQRNCEVQELLQSLEGAGWLNDSNKSHVDSSHSCDTTAEPLNSAGEECLSDNTHISKAMIARWRAELAQLDQVAMTQRRNSSSVHNQEMSSLLCKQDSLIASVLPFTCSAENAFLVRDTFAPSLSVDSVSINKTTSTTISNPAFSSKNATEILLAAVSNMFTLNDKQHIAYSIIACNFLARMKLGDTNKITDSHNSLRMFLTGPGGTGKSHLVGAVQYVMSAFGKEHCIRYLAPTGTAASLIDGMTIHKGLGLSIANTSAPSTSASVRGESVPSYSAEASVKNKSKLRAEWKDVEVVLIDEVSMMSLQLLADIDTALRIAKEKPDEFFGGLLVVFAGDLCQFPPVQGSPVYSNVRDTDTTITNPEMRRRLGYLAWQSLTDVVELTEQKRMSNDPEFAEIVSRLRLRQCIQSDADFFNTRVLSSQTNLDGVHLDTPSNSENTVLIVGTNFERQILNNIKASSVAHSSNGKFALHRVEAVDYAGSSRSPVSDEGPTYARRQLLSLDVTTIKGAHGVAPSQIPLYEGMQVVLKDRNISTEFRLTNGAMGTIRKIVLEDSVAPRKIAKVVFVHFPSSPIKLSGLPTGVVPITPTASYFRYSLPASQSSMNSKKNKTPSVRRMQVPLQPAFAVTAHFAQGKTLTHVTSALIGGFSGYVAASRPRTRFGLALTRHVTLADLNGIKLSPSLIDEMERNSVMAHNTLVRHGFLKGDVKHIPKSDQQMRPITIEIVDQQKRKKNAISHSESDVHLPAECTPRPSKRRRITEISQQKTTSQQQYALSPPCSYVTVSHNLHLQRPGCRWSSQAKTCAYDSVVTMLFYVYSQTSLLQREAVHQKNHILSFLARDFDRILQITTGSGSVSVNYVVVQNYFDLARDCLSRHICTARPNLIRNDLNVFTSVEDVLSVLFCDNPSSVDALTDNTRLMQLIPICCNTCPAFKHISQENFTVTASLPCYVLSLPTHGLTAARENSLLTIQLWLDTINIFPPDLFAERISLHSHGCPNSISSVSAMHATEYPFFWLGLPRLQMQQGNLLINRRLRVTTILNDFPSQTVLTLCALIFLNNDHYTTCYISADEDEVFYHDGTANQGMLKTLGGCDIIFNAADVYDPPYRLNIIHQRLAVAVLYRIIT